LQTNRDVQPDGGMSLPRTAPLADIDLMDRPELVAAHLARNLVALRHVRNLTQVALAKAAGVPRSTISNLESRSGNPSLTVLVKVASTLGVPLDELLASPRAKVRKWSRTELSSQSGGRGVTMRSLIPERVPDELLSVMEFAPGASMRGSPHLPGTREFFTCLAGEVTIFVAGDRFDLAAGDVLAFPGNVPHSYKNADGGRPAHGVSAVILAKSGV
jgi:XRE family transcriptional regulator, regulator of sulfur utilization